MKAIAKLDSSMKKIAAYSFAFLALKVNFHLKTIFSTNKENNR